MLSLRPSHLAFLCLFQCLFLALVPANAVPLRNRQNNLAAATTVMTQSTATSAAGDMTQTCVISLAPITDANGNPAVQEVKTCTITMGSVDNGTSSSSNSTGSSSDSSSTTSSADSSSATDSTGSTSASDTTASSTTDSASTASSSAAPGGGAVVANGVSSVPAPAASATSTDSASTGAASAASSDTSSATAAAGAAAISANSVTEVPASAVVPTTGDASAATATTAAAAAAENAASASASASAFAVPGQTLQVLPIGLGVFAGISVIALIVVGLVTYERTKYRKAFRARKLAESGAGMGYGGMAQR
ncbi:hypothetical protein DFH07DRAFT_857205 [Mycena maculata]|uniref:Uncharacterized protein n=1 Tax=Mycena maculata TaxID=230809 RepID=A0AAD7HJM2_9AGAR|nr:hypothetical protein DFH07DRAFT_857205 [Mycena maculata]